MKTLLFLILGAIALLPNCYAQPSLGSTSEDIVVNTQINGTKTYTVLKDARNDNAWYYIPNSVRLAERKDADGKVQPKFSLIKYNYLDRKTGELEEGGSVTFAVTFAAETDAIEQMVAALRKKNDKAALSPLPISGSKISIVLPSGEFTKELKGLSTNGPTFANQEIAFSIPLTVIGADVIENMAKGNAGLTIQSELSYTGYLPPCGFKATGKWDNVYNFVGKSTSFGGGVKWSFVNVGGNYNNQQVKEDLKTNLGLQINQYACGGNNGAKIDDYMQTFLTKIQEEVFSRSSLDSMKQYEKLNEILKDPATSSDKKKKLQDVLSTWSINLTGQHSVKKLNKRKTGDINISFDNAQIVDRSTRVDGTLSLQPYKLSEDELKKYILEVVSTGLPKALFGLPLVDPNLGIRNMSLKIVYKAKDGKEISETRQWKSEELGWTNLYNNADSKIIFSMLDRHDDIPFVATLSVNTALANASFKTTSNIDAFSGDASIDAIEALVNQFTIDASDLSFKKITGNESDLSLVKLKVTLKNNKVISKDIAPYVRNGVPEAPSAFSFILPESEIPRIEIVFTTAKGKSSVKQVTDIGDITLTDNDWKTLD